MASSHTMASRIFYAIPKGLQVTRQLLENNEDIDVNKVRVHLGGTPLHYACVRGNIEVVKYLIVEKKADVNSLDSHGRTPLSKVCFSLRRTEERMAKIAGFLLTNGADVNSSNSEVGETALNQACWRGITKRVQVLLNHGALIDAKNGNGATPLHEACNQRRIKTIKFLLANNADRHIQDNSGRVPADLLGEDGLEEVFQSYDKWPLAVSAAVDKMQQVTTPKKFTQGGTMVGLNPYLSQHQRTLALKAMLLVRQLAVHEVALEILGFLTPAAVEQIFLPAV